MINIFKSVFNKTNQLYPLTKSFNFINNQTFAAKIKSKDRVINYIPFHLAFPVNDLEKTRFFYEELIGCEIGREDPGKWIDFDFHGHQISAHLKPEECHAIKTNEVDGDKVPVRHFGLILKWDDWEELAQKFKKHNVHFIVEPHVRFQGKVGEQGTMFVTDPSGNALEFKTFKDLNSIFDH